MAKRRLTWARNYRYPRVKRHWHPAGSIRERESRVRKFYPGYSMGVQILCYSPIKSHLFCLLYLIQMLHLWRLLLLTSIKRKIFYLCISQFFFLLYFSIFGSKNLGYSSSFWHHLFPACLFYLSKPLKTCIPLILAVYYPGIYPYPWNKQLHKKMFATTWFIIPNHWKSTIKRRLLQIYANYSARNCIQLLITLLMNYELVSKKKWQGITVYTRVQAQS